MERSVAIVVVVVMCTILTRAVPFLLLGGKKEIPPSIQYLGKVLPSAIMAILVVYCLKNINFIEGNRGVPELMAVALVALLHLWKGNTLISIGVGTIFYMILVQAIF